MSVEQKVIVTAKIADGTEVRVRQETVKQVVQATTVEGDTVYIDSEATLGETETTVTVVFDDLDEKRTLTWVPEIEVPTAVSRIIRVVFFNGAQLVFSDFTEASKYLKGMAQQDKVVEFKRPENGQKAGA